MILTRKVGESFFLHNNVKITLAKIKGRQVTLGIEAPREVSVYREELYQRMLAQKTQPQ